MRRARFVKELEKDVPEWIARGFLSEQGGRDLLAYERSRAEGGMPYFTLALSVMGALLLGSGVITFFAANWGWLPKLAKLAILFGAMWGAYAVAAYLLGRGNTPRLGDALLLLAVILFGANIMLIAQIYHIAAHYPDGVLTWAAGALIAAYLTRSQAAAGAAVLLGILWNWFESAEFFREVHWPYLVFWAACLPLILRNRWRFAAHAQVAGFVIWSAFTLIHVEHQMQGALLYLAQIYFLGYLAALIAGMLMERREPLAEIARLAKRYSGAATAAALFLLTFPAVHRLDGSWWGARQAAPADPAWWSVGTVAALALVLVLAWRHRSLTLGAERPRYLDYGWALLGAIVVLIFMGLTGRESLWWLTVILYNVVFFAGLVWLVYAAIHAADRRLVNTAFFFFAIGFLARYLDTFWTLADRSYFFMTGGLVLLLVGYVLERGRRRITRAIADSAPGGRR